MGHEESEHAISASRQARPYRHTGSDSDLERALEPSWVNSNASLLQHCCPSSIVAGRKINISSPFETCVECVEVGAERLQQSDHDGRAHRCVEDREPVLGSSNISNFYA